MSNQILEDLSHELPCEPYFTKRMAAQYLSATTRFINLALADGSLKAYRPRRNFLRFKREDLDAWVTRQNLSEMQVSHHPNMCKSTPTP